MDEPIHIAIILRVRRSHVAEFEQALTDYARQSLAEPGARGVYCIYPPPGSDSTEYGVMRSFASAADRVAFYETVLLRIGSAASSRWSKAGRPVGNWLGSKPGFATGMSLCRRVGKWHC
jgi:hypothetical protein